MYMVQKIKHNLAKRKKALTKKTIANYENTYVDVIKK